MGELDLFKITSDSFNLNEFFLNMLLTIIYSFALSILFNKFSNSFTDRKKISNTFVLLAVSIMGVIAVVKSSLALSLGLVGALSIVRFRTAIKETEELAFLFVVIVLGISFGASQPIVGSAVFFISALIILFRFFYYKFFDHSDLNYAHLVITTKKKDSKLIEVLLKKLNSFCSQVELTRFDSNEFGEEYVFNVIFKNTKYVEDFAKEFTKKDFTISLISNN